MVIRKPRLNHKKNIYKKRYSLFLYNFLLLLPRRDSHASMTNSEIIIIKLLSFNATASFNHNNHAIIKDPWVREWVWYIGERTESSFEEYKSNNSTPPKISIKAH